MERSLGYLLQDRGATCGKGWDRGATHTNRQDRGATCTPLSSRSAEMVFNHTQRQRRLDLCPAKSVNLARFPFSR